MNGYYKRAWNALRENMLEKAGGEDRFNVQFTLNEMHMAEAKATAAEKAEYDEALKFFKDITRVGDVNE